MVIDSSVLVAILLGEPERDAFLRAIDASPIRLVSAMSKLETGIVMIGRRGPDVRNEVTFVTRLSCWSGDLRRRS